MVYLALSASDAGNLAKALREANVAARFYGPDLLLNDVYQDRAGDAAEGTRVTFATDPLTLANRFRVSQALPDGASTEGATLPAFAAVEVFAAAAKGSDVNNGRAMADWLKGGSSLMRPISPNVSAEPATIRKARSRVTGSNVGTIRLRLIPVAINPMTMSVNMVATVLPRSFSPESSEASER